MCIALLPATEGSTHHYWTHPIKLSSMVVDIPSSTAWIFADLDAKNSTKILTVEFAAIHTAGGESFITIGFVRSK